MPTAKKLPANTNVKKSDKTANTSVTTTVPTNTKKVPESSVPADKKDATIKKPPTMKEIRKKAAGLRDEMQILSAKRRKVNQEIESIAALVTVKEATRVYTEILYKQEADNSTVEEQTHIAENEEQDNDNASASDEEEDEDEDEDEEDTNAGGKNAAVEEDDDSDDADEADDTDK
jgi:hypothetical protein